MIVVCLLLRLEGRRERVFAAERVPHAAATALDLQSSCLEAVVVV